MRFPCLFEFFFFRGWGSSTEYWDATLYLFYGLQKQFLGDMVVDEKFLVREGFRTVKVLAFFFEADAFDCRANSSSLVFVPSMSVREGTRMALVNRKSEAVSSSVLLPVSPCLMTLYFIW